MNVHISLHECVVQNKNKTMIIFNYTNNIYYNIQNFYIKTYFYASKTSYKHNDKNK